MQLAHYLRMAKKTKGNLLESLLRYEIILALFTLIGVYYFLTFSPVRLPRQTITSPTIELPLPRAQDEKPDTAVNRGIEIRPAPPVSVDNQKKHKISATRLPKSTSHLQRVKVTEKKNPVEMEKGKAAMVRPGEPATIITGSNNKAAAGQKTSKARQQLPLAAKPVEEVPAVQTPAVTAPAATGRKSARIKRRVTTNQPARVKQLPSTPGGKSYIIQVGTFIFPETLKKYQRILKKHGYVSFVVTRERLLPMHRIFLGPYPTRASTREAIKTIGKWGDDPFISRRSNQFYINVGSFYYQSTAREKIDQYRSRGFSPVDFHEPVNVPHHILLVDGFSFNHYPRKALRSIKQLGIPDAFVRNRRP